MDNQVNKDQIWKEVLETIRISVSPPTFSTWISRTHLSLLSKKNDRYKAQIGCQSTFVRTTLEQRYFGLMQEALQAALQTNCDLEFVIKDLPAIDPNSNSAIHAPLFEEPKIETVQAAKYTDQMLNKLAFARLRPFFTFENFAVSGSNQMAHAAAEAVASNPGRAYNPLFLWGGVGVGKTHLMNAVGISILSKNADAKILACTGEDFTNDIVSGIRNKTTQSFRDKYRKLTALFIDDIQFIAGKDTVQEEFFHTFNAITSVGGQIILTSDRPPSEIPKLEERLRSRFEAGLIVDIAPPDFELRCAIMQIKLKEKGIVFPQEISNELISLIAGNIDTARKIEGFLIKLMSEIKLKRTPITPELIKSLLGKGGEEQVIKRTNIHPDQVVLAVSTHFSVNKRALMGKARSRMIARPRQILMYLLRVELGIPLEEVGRIVGGRDHSTVIHAVERVTQLASEDVHIREDLLGIKKSL